MHYVNALTQATNFDGKEMLLCEKYTKIEYG